MNRKLPISPNRQQAEKPAMVNPVNCMPVGQKLEDNSKHGGHMTKNTRTTPKKSVTRFFLTKEKCESVKTLQQSFKEVYKESHNRPLLKDLANDMWNSIQNEFYMTANISDNSIWSWTDKVAAFEESGYLLVPANREELTEWTMLLKGFYNQEWTYEVLKLLKDFSLDCQPHDYVVAFQNDFTKVKTQADFCAALLKWNDLIYWNPDKLHLLDNTFQQPLNSHYDDEFNDDCDFFNQEEV